MYKFIVTLRSRLLVFLTHNLALPILRLIRTPQKFLFTKEALHQLPNGSLGKDLVTMLDKKNLKLLPYYGSDLSGSGKRGPSVTGVSCIPAERNLFNFVFTFRPSQFKILSQVEPADFFIGSQGLSASAIQDSSVIE